MSSETLDITSGKPQGSLLCPLMFFVFINDHPDVLQFSFPYIFADDLKLLSINKGYDHIQADLGAISNWITANKMGLAMKKCTTIYFKGSKLFLYFQKKVLNSNDV